MKLSHPCQVTDGLSAFVALVEEEKVGESVGFVVRVGKTIDGTVEAATAQDGMRPSGNACSRGSIGCCGDPADFVFSCQKAAAARASGPRRVQAGMSRLVVDAPQATAVKLVRVLAAGRLLRSPPGAAAPGYVRHFVGQNYSLTTCSKCAHQASSSYFV